MKNRKQVRMDKGIKQRPSEGFELASAVHELAHEMPSARKLDKRQTELHELFGRLAELVDMVATSRHIETMEAYQIIDQIMRFYQ